MRSLVKELKPLLRIGVIGCMAQRLQDELMQIQEGIDFVVGG